MSLLIFIFSFLMRKCWWYWHICCLISLLVTLVFPAVSTLFSEPNSCCWESYVCWRKWKIGKYCTQFFFSCEQSRKLCADKILNVTGEQCCCWSHNRQKVIQWHTKSYRCYFNFVRNNPNPYYASLGRWTWKLLVYILLVIGMITIIQETSSIVRLKRNFMCGVY
jgi:hypothetical protein